MLIGRYAKPINSEVPEVYIIEKYVVECNSILCGWIESSTDIDVAEQYRLDHIEWHQEGMQE